MCIRDRYTFDVPATPGFLSISHDNPVGFGDFWVGTSCAISGDAADFSGLISYTQGAATEVHFNADTPNWSGTDSTDAYLGTTVYILVDVADNFETDADLVQISYVEYAYGCTDPNSSNYDSAANVDDGSCLTAYGCTNPIACNYDSTATVDEGSCIFPSVCTDATNLNTTDVVHSRATFNWDNTGAEYYRIRVNTGSGWSILTQIGAADGFAHPNASKTRYFLTPNTTYEWQVRGWCLDGSVSSWSASGTFCTLEECPHATNLGSSGVEGEWATMTWDAPAATHGVDYYLARVREVGSSSWNIKGNIGNGLSKTIGSLAQGATYEFETRTWCNTGDANNPSDPYYKSDWGGNGQFTTVPCPVQTDNLAVTQLTATSADFSWTLISATPAADHFTIRFREVGATTWNYRSVAGGGTATGRTIGGFTSGVDYEWEVRTFCGVGSTWKSPWFAGPDFNLGSGARVNVPFSDLQVYPNPSRGIFIVEFNSRTSEGLLIFVQDKSVTCTSPSIPPRSINNVFGIFKAYTTRVGSGPFPTELSNSVGQKLGEIGNEFGTVTGRQRRCGWFDAVITKHSIDMSCLLFLRLQMQTYLTQHSYV